GPEAPRHRRPDPLVRPSARVLRIPLDRRGGQNLEWPIGGSVRPRLRHEIALSVPEGTPTARGSRVPDRRGGVATGGRSSSARGPGSPGGAVGVRRTLPPPRAGDDFGPSEGGPCPVVGLTRAMKFPSLHIPARRIDSTHAGHGQRALE